MSATPSPQKTQPGTSPSDSYVPFALQIAAAWSWRLLVVGFAFVLIYQAFSQISLIVVSIMIAALLAGLLSPVVYFFRRRHLGAGLATAITEIGLIAGVLGLLALVGQQMVTGFSSMSSQVMAGWNQLMVMVNDLPIDLGTDQINDYLNQLMEGLQSNFSSILSGVASVGSTAADLGTGLAIVLFTLIFFLMEGEKIWLFIVKLFPRRARLAVNGAGRQGWKSLVSYVRVQVFVAAVDAVGIGLSAFFLGVPLALPLGVLVFLGSFIPVIGALLTGFMAVMLALVANGLVNALIMLFMVLLVQQIESNILQPLIMGKAVSLHPLAVLLAVLAGSMLYGIVGALFAVPVLAIVNTIIRYLAARQWEEDPDIRESEFLYPHEIKRRERKALAEVVKEQIEHLKHDHGSETKTAPQASATLESPAQNHSDKKA